MLQRRLERAMSKGLVGNPDQDTAIRSSQPFSLQRDPGTPASGDRQIALIQPDSTLVDGRSRRDLVVALQALPLRYQRLKLRNINRNPGRFVQAILTRAS